MFSFKLFLENRFYRPENYDKIKNLSNGRELWAGANDWEDGWSWAGIHQKGSKEPFKFLRIDHSECPCKGTLKSKDKSCMDYAKKQVIKWVK
jgi:hypothetical protein